MKKIINCFICHNNLSHEISEKNGVYHFDIKENDKSIHTETSNNINDIIKPFMEKYKEFFLKGI